MDARTIIDQLGGYRGVAAALGLSPSHVHNWTRRGIAAEYWPDVVDLARSRQQTHITVELLRQTRRMAKAAA